jgi:hypothetical protein
MKRPQGPFLLHRPFSPISPPFFEIFQIASLKFFEFPIHGETGATKRKFQLPEFTAYIPEGVSGTAVAIRRSMVSEEGSINNDVLREKKNDERPLDQN